VSSWFCEGTARAGDERPCPRVRSSPEDFAVEEVPLYSPSGRGSHTFVWVEKRLRTTEDVARELARRAGVPARDVGYAGRKDRVAVTRQWFSLPEMDPARALELELPGARVLRAERHDHKLRTGHLRGNRFEIVLREVDAEMLARAEVAREEILRVGMPNRFGPQRFGRSGSNVEAARRLLRGGHVRGERRAARFLISALQAAVFNQLLCLRPVPLNQVERGDIARKSQTGGLFLVEDEAIENLRAARFEISATGPIFGSRMPMPQGAVAEREATALEALGVPPLGELRPPRGIRMRGARRPLRVRLVDLDMKLDGDRLDLRFELPAGSYASVLLAELFGRLREGARDGSCAQEVP
jgi:tRNA pseudouridine13 synthase